MDSEGVIRNSSDSMETSTSDPTSGGTHTVHVSAPVIHQEDSEIHVSTATIDADAETATIDADAETATIDADAETATIDADAEFDTATVEINNYIDPENAGTESVYVVNVITTDNDESETCESTVTGQGHGDAYFGTETVISNDSAPEKESNNSVNGDETVENSKIITINCSSGKKVFKKLKTEGAHLNAYQKEAVPQAEKKDVSLPGCNMSPNGSSTKSPVIMFKWGSYKQPFRCQICDMLFASGDLLQQHMQKHAQAQNDPSKQFQCNLCLKSYQSRQSLERHQLSHSGQSQNRCRYCYKVFVNKENLDRHIVIHGDSKQHICPYCNEGFALFRSLEQHISIHLGWKDFKCQVCSRGFSRKDILDRHMFTHKLESEKKHKCVECEKDFRFLFSLKKHVRNVHGNEPDGKECEICGKFIKNRENLGRHMLTHSGQRPHECPTCGRKFTQKPHLQDHMLLHMNPSYFLCAVCDLPFRHERSLRRHLHKHFIVVNKDELQCRRCTEMFTTREDIIEHCKTLHKESNLLKWYSGKRTLRSKTTQTTSAELSKETKEQDIVLSGGDEEVSNASLCITNIHGNATFEESVTSEDMAVEEDSSTQISAGSGITFIVLPRDLEIDQVYSPDGTQLNFIVDHLDYVKKVGNQSVKINPKFDNDQNDENDMEDIELVENSMGVGRSKQQGPETEREVTESPEISGSQNVSDYPTDRRVLLQSLIDYAVKMQDLESAKSSTD